MSTELASSVISCILSDDLVGLLDFLQERGVSANARDSEGISFLHWAALNNRTEIVGVLLDKGAEINAACGVLNETPIFWSVRRSYHVMTELLVSRGADLQHRNVDGNSLLHLASQIEANQVSTLFLLLNWGAKSTADLDARGDTLVGGILKTLPEEAPQATSGTHHRVVVKALVRLLLRFGENPLHVDAEQNTALHAIAGCAQQDVLGLAFDIHQQPSAAAALSPSSMQNSLGHTPYTKAAASNNRTMTRLFFDALLFGLLPFWAPTFIAAACVVSVFLVADSQGFFVTAAYSALVWFGAGRSLLQWFIVRHRSRCFMGSAIGLWAVVLPLSWSRHLGPYCSFPQVALGLVLVAATVIIGIRVARTKPDALVTNRRNELAAAIIGSAPNSGPDDEALLSADPARRSRTQGPIVCVQCLADKRQATTHCLFCNACVIGQDFHSSFLGTCVGQGNRRIYLFAALSAYLSLAQYSLVARWVRASVLCPQAEGSWFYSFFAVEFCALAQQPASTLLAWIAFGCCCNLFAILWTFAALVTRRTTYAILSRGLVSGLSPAPSLGEALLRAAAFLRTGDFSVAHGSVTVTHAGGGALDCNRAAVLAFVASTLGPAALAKPDRSSRDDDVEQQGLLGDHMTRLHYEVRAGEAEAEGEAAETRLPDGEEDEEFIWQPPRGKEKKCRQNECRSCKPPAPRPESASLMSETMAER